MKHVERITFDGDDGKYGIRTGYCSDINGYVLKGQSGWVYDYSIYYSVSESEHAEVFRYIDRLNSGEIHLDQVVPGYHDRIIGANYIRTYDIKPFSSNTKFRPYIYKDAPFLCGDGIFYFHLYWQEHHYAAVPRLINSTVMEGSRRIRTGPYREREDISLIKVTYNGIEIPLCFGKEIYAFEGMEEWETFRNSALKAEDTDER